MAPAPEKPVILDGFSESICDLISKSDDSAQLVFYNKQPATMRSLSSNGQCEISDSSTRNRGERNASLPGLPGTPISPTDELDEITTTTCSPRNQARETLRSDYIYAEEFTPELMDALIQIGYTDRDFRIEFDDDGECIITFHMVPGARDVMRRLDFFTDSEEDTEGTTDGDEEDD